MKRIFLFLLPVLGLAAGDGGKSGEEPPGAVWRESVRNEAALEAALRYGREGGDPYLAAMRVAWLHFSAGNHAQAELHYRSAAQHKPGALSPCLGLLNAANGRGDAAAAAKAGEMALAIDKNHPGALYAVAWGAFLEGRHETAGAAYERILELYPEETAAASGAAWSAFHRNRTAEARRWFRHVLAMDPGFPDAAEGLRLCK